VIEVEVHQQLRAFLREQGEPYWAHHLTMARLVARALRLGRSALIQTGTAGGDYRLSYLVPLLMWSEAVVLVVPQHLHQRLLLVDIPRLQPWITPAKPIRVADRALEPHFQGILLTTPEAWLRDRLDHTGYFPANVPTVLDGVDDLETWTRDLLTLQVQPYDWEALRLACPQHSDSLRDLRAQLTRSLFQHPVNPYECYLIEPPDRALLQTLHDRLDRVHDASLIGAPLPPLWAQLLNRLDDPQQLIWATIDRATGQFSLHCSPAEVASTLAQIWAQQPTVLIGDALDLDTDATIYRQRLGLGDLTCLRFLPDRQESQIQLYQPDRIPLPNTPQYQAAMLREVRSLVSANPFNRSVILIGDTPLKAQVAAILAAEFGSRVQMETTALEANGVLVTGWDFWRQHQLDLPAPALLIVTTLPIPSLENPFVAGRVGYYKQLRQDWFRLYLLPEALTALQRAVAPVRAAHGVVALLDSRVIYRSYGDQVLAALSPFARLNYWDDDLFRNVG
jgi:ATP-dependent DNA helicase DinG